MQIIRKAKMNSVKHSNIFGPAIIVKKNNDVPKLKTTIVEFLSGKTRIGFKGCQSIIEKYRK